MIRRQSSSLRRGLAIVTFSMGAAVILPFLGLAMDGAMLCVVKERLTVAVESAASAARHYPELAKSESAARRFLDANFPEGHMGTGKRTITVENNRISVSIDAPTYFLKLLHIQNVEVAAARPIRTQDDRLSR